MLNKLEKGLLDAFSMNFDFVQTERQHLPEDVEACLLCPTNYNNNHNNNNNYYYYTSNNNNKKDKC